MTGTAAALLAGATAATVARGAHATTAGADGPDAELIAMGAILDDVAAREAEEWDNPAPRRDANGDNADALILNDRSATVVDQIEAFAATTLAGLQVKVRALAWCRVGEPITAEDIARPEITAGKIVWPETDDDLTTDMRLVLGIIRDLSAMGGVAA